MLVLHCFSAAVAGAPPGEREIYALLKLARNSSITPEQRVKAAEKGLDFLREQAGDQFGLKTGESLLEAYKKIKDIESHEKQKKIIESMGLSRVRGELDLLFKRIQLEEAFKNCNSRERNLEEQFYCGMEKCANSCMVLNEAPLFVHQGTVKSLVETLQKSGIASSEPHDRFNPEIERIKKADSCNDDSGAVLILARARGEIYRKSIEGEIRNKLTLFYQYSGTKPSWDEVKAFADTAVRKDCTQCTPRMKEQIRASAINHLHDDIKAKKVKNETREAVVDQLCASLKNSGFSFQPYHETPRAQSLREEMAKHTGTLPDDAMKHNRAVSAYDTEKQNFEKERMEVLNSLAIGGGHGLLLFTESMMKRDRNRNMETLNLSCDPSRRAADTGVIEQAYHEASQKTDEYAKRINDVIRSNDLSYAQLKKELKEMMKIAPQTVGEAIGNNLVAPVAPVLCNVLKEIKADDTIDAIADGAVFWGSVVVGAAVTYFSGGTVGPWALGGLMLMNAGAGVYAYSRAQDASELSKEYEIAAAGQDSEAAAFMRGMSDQEFQRFREYQFQAWTQGVFSAIEVGTFLSMAAKSGKTAVQLNEELLRILKDPSLKKTSWLARTAEGLPRDVAVVSGISAAHSVYSGKGLEIDPLEVAQGLVLSRIIHAASNSKRWTQERKINKVQLREELETVKAKWIEENPGKTPNAEQIVDAYLRRYPQIGLDSKPNPLSVELENGLQKLRNSAAQNSRRSGENFKKLEALCRNSPGDCNAILTAFENLNPNRFKKKRGPQAGLSKEQLQVLESKGNVEAFVQKALSKASGEVREARRGGLTPDPDGILLPNRKVELVDKGTFVRPDTKVERLGTKVAFQDLTHMADQGDAAQVYRVEKTDGSVFFFKPRRQHQPSDAAKRVTFGVGELVAYKLDKSLGFDRVPPVFEGDLVIEGKRVEGVYSQFAPNRGDLSAANLDANGMKREVRDMVLFDYILGNPDRHTKNGLVDPSGKLVWIDHGMAGKSPTHNLFTFSEHAHGLLGLKENPFKDPVDLVRHFEGKAGQELLKKLIGMKREQFAEFESSSWLLDGIFERRDRLLAQLKSHVESPFRVVEKKFTVWETQNGNRVPVEKIEYAVVDVPRKNPKSHQEMMKLLESADIDSKYMPFLDKTSVKRYLEKLDHEMRLEAEADLGWSNAYKSRRGNQEILKFYREVLGATREDRVYQTYLHETDHAIATAVRNEVIQKGGHTRFDIDLFADNNGLGSVAYKEYMSSEEFGTHWNDFSRLVNLKHSPTKSMKLAEERFVKSVLDSEGLGKSEQELKWIRKKAESEFSAIQGRLSQQKLTDADREILKGITLDPLDAESIGSIKFKSDILLEKIPVMQEMINESLDIVNAGNFKSLQERGVTDKTGKVSIGKRIEFDLPNSRRLEIFVPAKHAKDWTSTKSYLLRYFSATLREQDALRECMNAFYYKTKFLRENRAPNYLEMTELAPVLKRVSFVEPMLDAPSLNGKAPKSFTGIAKSLNQRANGQSPSQSP